MSALKPYRVIEGSQQALTAFESAVAAAMEEGYTPMGDLVVKTSGTELKFFQPMIWEESFPDEEDEDEDDEEEEED